MKLSVVIPAYNEEKRIQDTLLDLIHYLKHQKFDYEIIVVVNNSHDKTYEIAQKFAATQAKQVIPVNLIEGGKGNAVKRGILEHANGDIIMFMDADNATPISEIEKFFPYFNKGYDVVIGSRYTNPKLVKHKQPLYRVILSRMSNMLIQVLAVPGIKDTQLGFKAFSHKAAKDIFPRVSILRWGFDMEVLTIALAHHYKIKEVGVSWTEHGGSHVPLKAYIESLIDLFKIKINSMSGSYEPTHKSMPTKALMRDYDYAALAGFLTGLCAIPTLYNLGVHRGLYLGAAPIIIAILWVTGIWLGYQLSKIVGIMFQLSKFVAVGFLNTAIDFGILNLASIITGVTSGLLIGGFNVPGFIVAAINSYVWNKAWVFRSAGHNRQAFFKNFPRFAIVTILGLLINTGIVVAFTSVLHPLGNISPKTWLNISKVLATCISLLWNFLGYKFLVFVSAKKTA